MAVRTIEYLLNKFGAGKSPGSSDYVDLIDTLADDRNAVYFASTAPEDTSANPLWFNTTTQVLSVYNNGSWISGSGGSGTVTGITAGSGLSGGTITNSGTISVDTSIIATRAYADSAAASAVSAIVDAAPGTLDTLNELAAALGDDPNYATTISTSLGNKLDSATAASTYATISNLNLKTPVIPMVSGLHYRTPIDTTSTIFVSSSLNRTWFSPIYIPTTTTFDRMTIRTASGWTSTGCVVRLGIFNSDSNGNPSTVLLDAGTVTATTISTNYPIEINQTLSPGLYWLASNAQSNVSGTASLSGANNLNTSFNTLFGAATDSPGSSYVVGFQQLTFDASNGFSNNPTLTRASGYPIVWLRVA